MRLQAATTLVLRPALRLTLAVLLAGICVAAEPTAPVAAAADPTPVAAASAPPDPAPETTPLLNGAAEEASATDPDPYGGCYTAEELAALDRALWVVNATRQDLHFKKDYAKGYECFPIVREMMADPLKIGEVMERLQDECAPSDQGTSWTKKILQGSVLITFDGNLNVYREGFEQNAVSRDKSPMQSQDLNMSIETRMLVGVCHALLQMYGVDIPDAAKTEAFREWLPSSMAWHAVDSTDTKIASEAEAAQNKDNCAVASQIGLDKGAGLVCGMLANAALDPTGLLQSRKDMKDVYPEDKPLIVDTDLGRICLGTPNDDTYTGDFAVLIDPGGNDHYVNCRIGAAYGKRVSNTDISGAGVPARGPSAAGTEARPTGDEDYSPLGDGRVGFFCDLGGDDFYDCADVDITLGAAVLGVAAFYDLGGGDDRYYGGNFSLGAASGGIATFYDDGGSDYYSGKVYTQGAAGFGIAIMCDDSVQPAPVVPTDVETPDPIDVGAFDNDTYSAWSEAQGFARTRGVAICANKRGNELYHAGGVYLDAPLFSDRYCSFSQGFAIGERDIDYAGGIALLADYGGNDRYLGDVYNQGVGYWYSAGFLYDGGGNDLYEMTQYGQGSGIHLAVGGLIDEAGSDTYIMHNGLGQSGSHDFAASLLMDKAGNDRYLGNTSCNGCGLTNAVGLFFDRSGDDVYAARDDSGINFGRPARGFGSLGVFVDLGGADSYLGKMDDAVLWQRTTYGVGLDYDPAKMAALVPASANTSSGDNPVAVRTGDKNVAPTGVTRGDGFDKPTADVKMPDEVHYEGALTQEIFDKLWEIAIRWEVGDNRAIVPEARKRLIAFGPEVLPYVEAKMDDPNSLAIRGYVDVFKAFAYKPLPPPDPKAPAPAAGQPAPPAPEPEVADGMPLIEALLTRQLQSGADPRKLAAISVITELKIKGVAPALTALLDDADLGMQRRAIAALGAVGSSTANDRLVALLDPTTDEALTKVSIETLSTLKADCYAKLRLLLGSPSFTVRDVLENQLVAQWATYGADVSADYLLAFGGSGTERQGFGTRARRTLLRIMLRNPDKPTAAMVDGLYSGLGDPDWGVVADTVELTRYWSGLCADDPDLDILFSGNTGLSRELSGYAETTPNPQPLKLPEK